MSAIPWLIERQQVTANHPQYANVGTDQKYKPNVTEVWRRFLESVPRNMIATSRIFYTCQAMDALWSVHGKMVDESNHNK